MDGSYNVGFILNTNHDLRSDSCDLDKYKVIFRGNICFSQQVSPRFFIVSRRSQAHVSIDANPYCFP